MNVGRAPVPPFTPDLGKPTYGDEDEDGVLLLDDAFPPMDPRESALAAMKAANHALDIIPSSGSMVRSKIVI